MKSKIFEIRDIATFIPVLAVKLDYNCTNQENWLLSRAGYGNAATRNYVILTNLNTGESAYDPYKWGKYARTMPEAHKYILDHFDSLDYGAVIDIEYVLGEVSTPKISERGVMY